MVCSKCGTTNPDDTEYCMRCAAPLRPAEKPSLEIIAERMVSQYDRAGTDKRVSPWWILILFLTIVPSAVLGIGYVVLNLYMAIMDSHYSLDFGDWSQRLYGYGLPLFEMLFGILAAILVSRLIGRLNTHLEREGRLTRDLVAYVRTSATPEQLPKISDELLVASSHAGLPWTFEKTMDAKKWGLWIAVLYVLGGFMMLVAYELPWMFFERGDLFDYIAALSLWSKASGIVSALTTVVLLVIAIHLMRTLSVHQLRWREFIRSVYDLMGMIGKKSPSQDLPKKPRERSVVLYALLTLVTFGLFGFYWLYALIDDPNKHFEEHVATEETLFAGIRGW